MADRTNTPSPRNLGDETGSAMLVAIGVLLILMTAFGIAGISALRAQVGGNQDRSAKKVLAGADAGASQAVRRLNKIFSSDSQPCVWPGADGSLTIEAVQSDSWCRPVSGQIDGVSYTYTTQPIQLSGSAQNLQTRKIVVTASQGDQTRRVAIVTSSPLGRRIFSGKAVQSLDQLTVSGSTKVLGGKGAGSNKDIVISGSAYVCGDVTPGPGYQLKQSGSATLCSGSSSAPATRPIVLAPVNQRDVRTVNDNGRFFGSDPKTGNVSWSATSRVLTLTGNASLTLGGGDYSFCKLDMSGNSKLIIAQGASPRIFFDTPEACGLTGSDTQLKINGSARIDNTSLDPSRLEFLLAGSTSVASNVQLDGNSALGQQFIVYAPNSIVAISGNSTLNGSVTAKQVTITGSSIISYDGRVDNVELDVQTLYSRESWVECTSKRPAGTAPDGGC